MATHKKKDGPLREKAGTSPSPTPTKTKKSPIITNPTQDQKQIPNYLKPTISSSGLVDHPTPIPKKQGISSNKPNLNRRRSFDKPPSFTSHNKSPHVSLRSPSPVLSKVNSLPKPHTKKIIPSSHSGKANTGVKKTENIISSTQEKEKNEKEGENASTEVDNFKKRDEEFLVDDIKEEEVKVIEINNIEFSGSEVPIIGNSDICEDVNVCNLDDKDEHEVDVEKEIVEKYEDEKVEEIEMEKEVTTEGGEEEKGDENEKEKEKDKEEDVSENAKEDVNEGNEDVKIEGKNEIEPNDGEIKGEDEEVKDTKNVVGNGSGKKEAQQNDVIEKAKNKLLEKRKNKVKALVGAFETVMSLQEPEP